MQQFGWKKWYFPEDYAIILAHYKRFVESGMVMGIDRVEVDYLTHLPNRQSLYRYFSNLDEDTTIHAMFLDVDNYKRVNDIYGHTMGDKLLVCIGEFLSEKMDGFISRIGGDEFVILFDGQMSNEQVVAIAEQLLEEFREMDFRKDVLSLISLSIGIILRQSVNKSLDEILTMCDTAMYQAKYAGKNRYFIYKANSKIFEINRNIEAEMDDALKNREFSVYFQPKVNMVSSDISGAEALSRWVHPTEGIRMPMMYIPVFEKNGFIAQLDMYVFEETCRIKSGWKGRKYEHLPISVNMSRLHLYDKLFPQKLEEIATKYGIPTSELELEITENTFIKDSVELIDVVIKLKERGFAVSIDDFGSGFSALHLLKDLPVDIIKIDRGFLQDSSANIRGKKIIRNIIGLCKDLKLDVVTEGVETKEQIDFITSCGCQVAQGFYYAKPLPLEEFEAYVEEHISNPLDSYTFHLDGDLKSEDGGMEGIIIGEGLRYEQGIFRDSKSLYFPGGGVEKNIVELPPAAIVNDSYTISVWLNPRESHLWVSAFYAKFEGGFCSILPLAWEGVSDFRIRDYKDLNGWYDVSGSRLRENVWTHFVVSYNAKTETAFAFINGERVGVLENVPTNRYVTKIILGGDVYQPSYIGNMCELVIYNEAKDYDFVKELHESYVTREDYVGMEVSKW